MIITIKRYKCSEAFMPDQYELNGITEGLINVAGVPTEMVSFEQSKRILVSCKTIENGIQMIKKELPENVHVRQLISLLNKKGDLRL